MPVRDQNESIWDSDHRGLTIGSILAMTIVAFQGLAMATVAPMVAEELGGRDLYGWIFSAFLLPQIVGTVLAGREVDRRSPAIIFTVALISFAIGCLIAGFAPSIYWLFLGRAVQGFGAGAITSCTYAVVATAYEDKLRPSMLAAMSSAWIVPSLIGPAIAGFVAEQFSWRWAFFGLMPIVMVIWPLTLPTYRKIVRDVVTGPNDNRLMLSVILAIATGVFLVGLEVRPVWIGVAVTIVGLVGLVPTLRKLLPSGSFTMRPIVPAAIVSRGLAFGGFAVVETYMIFALKDFGGVSATEAGLVLTITSLFWSGGSFVQARWDKVSDGKQRTLRMVIGFGLLLVATTVLFVTVAVFGDIWLKLCAVIWSVAGLGIGLAYPTTVTVAFAYTPKGQDGLISSSMMLADLFAFSVGVGVGGVLLAIAEAAGWSTPAGTAFAMSLGVVMVLGSVVAAGRTRVTTGQLEPARL